jgi:glycosyltransferase involved in cell wall biosynthesis
MNNLVSILIPCYNSEKYISKTIESCLSQTYKNIEVIIVDDGSTDNSYQIAKSYESDRIKVYKQKNSGACRARNYAFELSRNEKNKEINSFCFAHRIKIHYFCAVYKTKCTYE